MDIALRKKNVYNPVEVINMSKEVKTNAMRMLDKHHIQAGGFKIVIIIGLHEIATASPWSTGSTTQRPPIPPIFFSTLICSFLRIP